MSTPTDLANRALQRVGGGRIAAGALLTEDSKNAAEIRGCYDTLRRAELRRNVWRFAIRTAALRAISTTTKFVTFGLYAAGTSYAINDIVRDSLGTLYQSRVAANIGNTPLSSPASWALYSGPTSAELHDIDLTYYAGELVYISSTLYVSKVSANGDTPPTANWFTPTTAATLSDPQFVYPIGAGPVSQSSTRNVFKLPAGYLREAPQNPKYSFEANDWMFENAYFTSDLSGPLVFRFASDVADVDQFDPMFFEGFAARIAYEICEVITQSAAKKAVIAADYQKFMAEARTVNGIETGPVELPLDDYITVRY